MAILFSRCLCKVNDFYRKCIGIFVKLHFPPIIVSKFYDSHYHFVNKKILPYLNKAYLYLINDSISNNHMGMTFNSKIIWIFWWQGYKEMPDLVYYCISSIFKHSNNHKIVLITKNNIKKYTNIPNYIYHKLYIGSMTFTHFSDILRFNLLRNHGGLWLDATIYCTSAIPSYCFDNMFTAQEGYEKYHSNVSLGKWTGFLIGGDQANNLFIFMDNFFRIYWKYNNYLIDYFLIDYALNYAYSKNISGFKTYVDKRNPTPHVFQMLKLLNKKFNKKTYNLLTSDTHFFKLTYKKKIIKNKNNFYNVLINNIN